jgi:tRNA A37 threonylcarbamoyladenosine modification protein TsaB
MSMILFLDVRNDGATAAVLDAKAAKWTTVAGQRAGFDALAKAKRLLGARAPACVVVAMGAGEKRDVSWSTVRAGVAMANALAFAWGVPAAEIAVAGDDPRAEVEKRVRAAAKKAKRGRWVGAAYSGEPTITKAKKIL